MKKRLIPLLGALLILTAGCGGGARDAVSTDGSTSMAVVMAALGEAYREKHPGVVVNYSGTGSGAGVEAVLAGTCDIGLSSRELTEAERAAGAAGHLAALDGVAVVVHPDNPIRELTLPQLTAVFTGLITQWSQLGGPAAPIAVYGREAGSGTRSAFEAAVSGGGRCVYTNEYGSAGDVAGGVAANPNAIGYLSLAAVDGSVVPLSLGGAACTLENLQAGLYPIWRPFLLVTGPEGPRSAAAGAFLNYALSPAAAGPIARAGAAHAAPIPRGGRSGAWASTFS